MRMIAFFARWLTVVRCLATGLVASGGWKIAFSFEVIPVTTGWEVSRCCKYSKRAWQPAKLALIQSLSGFMKPLCAAVNDFL